MLRLLPIAALIFMFAGSALAQEARLITSVRPLAVKSAPATPVEPNEVEKRAFEQTNLVRVKNGTCNIRLSRRRRIPRSGRESSAG